MAVGVFDGDDSGDSSDSVVIVMVVVMIEFMAITEMGMAIAMIMTEMSL